MGNKNSSHGVMVKNKVARFFLWTTVYISTQIDSTARHARRGLSSHPVGGEYSPLKQMSG